MISNFLGWRCLVPRDYPSLLHYWETWVDPYSLSLIEQIMLYGFSTNWLFGLQGCPDTFFLNQTHYSMKTQRGETPQGANDCSRFQLSRNTCCQLRKTRPLHLSSLQP